MKNVLRIVFSMAALGCLLTVGSVLATAQEGGAPAPDNTKVNQRDQNQAAPTADQQKTNKADQETTRQIRRAVVRINLCLPMPIT
jgi:pyruvate/2-oxoglutarate dehydrogenase complex dihydrolipoamide acyltransferase (E2) component